MADSTTPTTEVAQFAMHPALLFSVIKAQAGTVSKAILELVMNSVDAGATRVDVQIDRKSIRIADDGKGFVDRTEIDNFFRTFGTPHEEGDATYGKFRMGRGQIMAFTVNEWRSGPFRMKVDVQNKGLDFILETGLANATGCQIDGELYEKLDPSELINTERNLADQCRFTPIPVYLNGNRISEDPALRKWSRITDEAYILADSSRQLAVYNLGVLVANFDSSDFGVGGIVVSRKQLELNFARNDILRNKCQVWRAIRPVLTALSAEVNGREPSQRRTEGWRTFQAKRMLTTTRLSYDEYREFVALPVITDISGKHMSIEQLFRQAHDRQIVIAPKKTLAADKLHQSRVACVLSADTFTFRFQHSLVGLLTHLKTIEVQTRGGGCDYYIEDFASKIESRIADFDVLAKSVSSDHHVMPANKIPKDVAAALRTIRKASSSIVRACNVGTEYGQMDIRERVYAAMESETADAYTDGRGTIFINVKLLRGADGPNTGATWAARMAALLVHEYKHDFDSGTGHIHDADFYEAFHDAVSSAYFGYAVTSLLLNWADVSKEDFGKTGTRALKHIDAQARIDDRQESLERLATV